MKHDQQKADEPVVRVQDLSVTYPGGFQALYEVSFELWADNRIALIGPSGCGKSTLAKALLGLLPPGSIVTGDIQVVGVSMLTASESQRRTLRGLVVGYVAQDPFAACDPLHTVGRHIEAAHRMHRLVPPRGGAEQELDSVHVLPGALWCRRRPHEFSGGMLQRASIAAGTVHHPQMVIADEPTSALDTDLAADILALVRERSATLLLITHDLLLARSVCDQALVLSEGKLVENAPITQVLAKPVSAAAQALVAALPKAEAQREHSAGRIAIRGTEISHRYDQPVLSHVTVDVRRGEVLGIHGPSGCGKSTLLRLLCGIEKIQSGEVVFFDDSGAKLRRRPPGFVMPIFQDPLRSLSPRWPIWRSLVEPLRLRGERRSVAEWQDRAKELLTGVGVHVDLRRKPQQLSVGQAQRVAVARALAACPTVIVADEPTASLDVISADRVATLLAAAADDGIAVVMVSHDLPRLRSIAHRTIMMGNEQ